MSQRGGDNDAGDLQLEAELAALVREREEIIAGSAIDASPELLRFKEALRRKLKAAADQREYQRANLRLQFDFEKQQAMDEYHFEKEKLREQIISAHAERRKRLESVKSSGVAKRGKRSRAPVTSPSKSAVAAAAAATAAASATATAGTPADVAVRGRLAGALEARGLVRVMLPPDEINRDIALILGRLDSARSSGTAHHAVSRGAGGIGGANGTSARKTDAIHSSRGILHFHNDVFEKGDNIVAFVPGKSGPPKFAGIIMSINGKEIQVRSHRSNGEGKQETNRVYVSHLRKDSIRISHA